MKKYVSEFFRRGFMACGIGPIVLAVLYLILQRQAGLETLTVGEVCVGIFSISALAFIAGGMNVLYQIERLPLLLAILIHGVVLFFCYLFTYLVNGWLEQGTDPIMIFTVIFVIGYLLIWAFIYFVTERNTRSINEKLRQRQQDEEAGPGL